MNFSANYSSSACLQLHWDAVFVLATLLILIFALLAMVFSLTVFKLLWKSNCLLHANVRLVLLHFCAANITSSVFAIIRSIYNTSIIIFDFSGTYITNVTACAAVDALALVPTIVACVTIGLVGFERFAATCRRTSSDPDTSSRTFKHLTVLLWILAVANCAMAVADTYRMSRDEVCYCSLVLTMSQDFLFATLPFYIIFETAYLFAYFYVYVKNKTDLPLSINTAKHSLQERYTKFNNVRVAESLFANVISNSVLYIIVGCSYYFIHPLYWQYRDIQSINLLLSVFVLMSFVAFLQPLLLLIFNGRLRKLAYETNSIFRPFLRAHHYLNSAAARCEKMNLLNVPADNGSMEKSPGTVDENFAVVQYRLDSDKTQQIIESIWETNTRK